MHQKTIIFHKAKLNLPAFLLAPLAQPSTCQYSPAAHAAVLRSVLATAS